MTTKETNALIEARHATTEEEKDAIRRECGWTEAEMVEGSKDMPADKNAAACRAIEAAYYRLHPEDAQSHGYKF